MNIIFMGTPDFAQYSLEKIYESGHNILAVISQPDRPSGRGLKLRPTPVKTYAESKGLKVYQPDKIRKCPELINKIKNMKPDVIVVVAFGQILPQSVIDIPKYGCINVHGSLLPSYRGAAPIQWAIINGDKVTGITTMYMDACMDTGDVILKEEIKIEDSDTFGILYEKLKKLGGNLLLKTLEKIADGTAPRQKQPEKCTMAPMIEKNICEINWDKSAIEIRNLIRGLNPTPGAYTTINCTNFKIWDAEVVEKDDIDISAMKNGTVICTDNKKGIYIKTGNGILCLKEIQMENSKRMSAIEFLKGNKL